MYRSFEALCLGDVVAEGLKGGVDDVLTALPQGVVLLLAAAEGREALVRGVQAVRDDLHLLSYYYTTTIYKN